MSGNPNAGAAVVAEAQNQEYQAYWQQYQQQWSQWAAWNQYSQQMAQQQQQQQQQPPPLPQEKGEEEEQKPKSVGPGESIFDGDEMDLVGMHTFLTALQSVSIQFNSSFRALGEN